MGLHGAGAKAGRQRGSGTAGAKPGLINPAGSRIEVGSVLGVSAPPSCPLPPKLCANNSGAEIPELPRDGAS